MGDAVRGPVPDPVAGGVARRCPSAVLPCESDTLVEDRSCFDPEVTASARATHRIHEVGIPDDATTYDDAAGEGHLRRHSR